MAVPIVDYSEEWTEEDLEDLNRATLERAAESLGETDCITPVEPVNPEPSDPA